MAVSNLSFAAQVDAWTRQTEQRMTAVFRGSTQEVFRRAQERTPVDTGFARASIRASTQSMPPIDPTFKGVKGSHYPDSNGQVIATIASAELGETIYLGWTASYAGVLETGHSKQAPSGFVGITAMEWPVIVQGEIARAKASVARNTP